jgi:hypothetical protein
MGYRGDDHWHDMSDYVVHFTKPVSLKKITSPPPRTEPGRLTLGEFVSRIRYHGQLDRTGYDPWIKILGGRTLKTGAKPLGAARRVPGIEDSQLVVCFSEIPLDMLDRLVERRSLYGLGFSKATIVGKGGAPLWYLGKEGEQAPIVRRRSTNASSEVFIPTIRSGV